MEIEKEEREARRKKNPRERAVMDAYRRDGWEIITRGFPSFVARKVGQPVRLVWVERKHSIPQKAGLKESQRKMVSIFSSILGEPNIRVVDPLSLER